MRTVEYRDFRQDGRLDEDVSRFNSLLNSPLKKSGRYRLVKNDDMQGAQIARNESYIEYVAVTRMKRNAADRVFHQPVKVEDDRLRGVMFPIPVSDMMDKGPGIWPWKR